MNKIFDRIAELPNMRFMPGASAKQISEFEAKTGITLPLAYKEWLGFTDGGEIFTPGVEFLGVGSRFPRLLVRRGDGTEAPSNLAVIGRTAGGDAICFEDGCQRIIQWNHETGEEFLSWGDFYEYLGAAEKMYGGDGI